MSESAFRAMLAAIICGGVAIAALVVTLVPASWAHTVPVGLTAGALFVILCAAAMSGRR